MVKVASEVRFNARVLVLSREIYLAKVSPPAGTTNRLDSQS